MRLSNGAVRGTLTVRFARLGTVTYRCTLRAAEVVVGGSSAVAGR